MLFVLYRGTLEVSREDACRECRRSWVLIPPRAKFVFHILLFRVECEELFCKTYIKPLMLVPVVMNTCKYSGYSHIRDTNLTEFRYK